MLDSEEQVQQRLPIPLPRAMFGSSDESDGETDDDVPIATPSASDPVEGDTKVPLQFGSVPGRPDSCAHHPF